MLGDCKTKCLDIKHDTITVQQLRDFLADIPGDTEIELDTGGGSGYITQCAFEYMDCIGYYSELTLCLEAESCYY